MRSLLDKAQTKLAQKLTRVREHELAWAYSNFSFVSTLRTLKHLLPAGFVASVSSEKLVHVLNFLRNQRMFALKPNELMEVVLFAFAAQQSLHLSEVAFASEVSLADCEETCAFPFRLWNSKGLFGDRDWEEDIRLKCRWALEDSDSGRQIAPSKVGGIRAESLALCPCGPAPLALHFRLESPRV